jgi:drug/metabolite transporter (DMT)-like permease
VKWILVGFIILCNAAGDLLNTYGMRRNGPVEEFDPRGLVRLIRSLRKNIYVIGGVSAMAASFFALMALLSIANVSFAVPATAGSFLLETVLAKIILKEEVHWQRWMGAVVVMLGVGLLALP